MKGVTDPTEMRESCALDVATKGGLPDYTVAEILGVSQQRVSVVEQKALVKLKTSKVRRLWEES